MAHSSTKPLGQKPLKLGVLVSGSGRTLQNFVDQIAAGQLNATVATVIGSRPGLQGVERAAGAGLPHHVVDRKSNSTISEFSQKVFAILDAAEVDLICMAGWLCLLDIPKKYHGRIMNIHPSLLPSFGGKGMFGHHVHEAVLAHGCKISGCTVHFVDAAYDNGPIILQRTCPVHDTDTADDLATRVFEQETLAFPEAIKLFAEGRLSLKGRVVCVAASNR